MRTPDEILNDVDFLQSIYDGHNTRFSSSRPRIEVRDLMWEVIEDIRESLRLATMNAYTDAHEVRDVVDDYIAAHYGDD